MRRKSSAAGAASAVVLLFGVAASAQSPNKTAAVALYDEAEKLMAQERYSEACPKYAESNRLDPQLGVLLHLADCYEKEGKLASAWATFRDASDLADRRADARSLAAKDRATALEGRLSRLTISVPDESAVPGLEVERDGIAIGSAVWGTPVPVDAGPHTVRAKAPGKLAWESSVELAETGDAKELIVPVLTDTPPAPAAGSTGPGSMVGADSAAGSGAASFQAPSGAQPSQSGRFISGRTQRTLGWVSGGVGLAGVGLGIAYLVRRSNRLDERDEICPASVDCAAGDQARIDDLTDQAQSASTVGALGMVLGGVFLAGGVALVLTAPQDHPSQGLAVAPLVGTSAAGLFVSQVW